LPSYLTAKGGDQSARSIEGQDLAVLEAVERDLVARSLERHRGRTADAAAELGIHRSTLWRKMKRFRLVG
jgi:transcriptional regulator of acetoin/glycerol metabolism